jgi:uncharacterized surface protein with fasciclin (FAS1) repeats
MFDNKDSVAPILVSMFLGLLTVLIIGGVLMNFAAKNRAQKATQPLVKIEKNQIQKTTEKSFWAKLKEKLTIAKKSNNKKNAQTPSPTVSINENVMKVVPEEETKTFLNFVTTSDLSEIRNEKGDVFTLLMPTNKAFVEVQDALQSLTNRNDKNALQSLMKRHIIRGKVSGGLVRTLSGEDVIIDFTQKTVTFDGIVAHILEIRGDSIIIDKVLY